MDSPSNLLVRLHKWAVRQDENFLTEAFAHLLQHLLAHEPEAGVRLTARLTNGVITEAPERAKSIEVRTQVLSSEGTPDIRIRTVNAFVIVEVKKESPPRAEQLARYRELLERERITGLATALVLVTRYAVDVTDVTLKLRWYEIAQWLGEESQRYAFQAVSAYLTRQFMDFLAEKDMIMEQVTWELSGGVRALRSLIDMLYEAALACKLSVKKRARWDNLGIKINGKYWAGIMLDDPATLWFATHCKIDTEAAAKLAIGEVGQYNWAPGGNTWERGIQLNSEEVHFFSRTRAGQMQWLEKFLRECVDLAETIATPDQPPIVDEPEEG